MRKAGKILTGGVLISKIKIVNKIFIIKMAKMRGVMGERRTRRERRGKMFQRKHSPRNVGSVERLNTFVRGVQRTSKTRISIKKIGVWGRD